MLEPATCHRDRDRGVDVVKRSPGADPHVYRPRPPLADYIDYFGYCERDAGNPHQSRALPRGAATIIIDVGGRQRVDFYAADGHTRLNVPPAFIAGAGTASYVTRIEAAQTGVDDSLPAGGRQCLTPAVDCSSVGA